MNKFNVKFLEIENDIENKILAVLEEDYFTISLERQKSYERHFTDFVRLCLKSGDIALDLGANVGYHTITMAELVKNGGKIHSFEPQRIIFQQLNCNVFLNRLDNVDTYNLAIGDSYSDVSINCPNYHHISPMHTNIGNTSINTKNIGYKVRQIPLDSLGLNRLDFIKLDIQGCELLALKGAKNLIEKYKPTMFMEIEEKQLIQFNTSPTELINYTKELGYKLYRVIVTGFEIISCKEMPNCVTDDYLCIPIENTTIDLNKYPYKLIEI